MLDVPDFPKNSGIVFMMPQEHSINGDYNLETIESQQRIFEALKDISQNSGVKDFFVEGFDKEYSNSQLYNLPQAQTIRKIFSDKNKKDTQNILMAKIGAPTIFLMLFDNGLTIHPTTTSTQLKTISGKINSMGLSGACDDLTGSLEYQAEAAVKDFQKQNPGKNVALIFGEGHDFSDNFSDQGEKYYLVKIKQDLNYLFKQIKDCKKQ